MEISSAILLKGKPESGTTATIAKRECRRADGRYTCASAEQSARTQAFTNSQCIRRGLRPITQPKARSCISSASDAVMRCCSNCQKAQVMPPSTGWVSQTSQGGPGPSAPEAVHEQERCNQCGIRCIDIHSTDSIPEIRRYFLLGPHYCCSRRCLLSYVKAKCDWPWPDSGLGTMD